MISLDKALAYYDSVVSPLGTHSVKTADALNHVLAAPARSRVDLPPFTRAAVDGYALRATNTANASEINPARLKIAGDLAAGTHDSLPRIQPGQCLRILTGAPLPPDCDAVVMQEDARRDQEHITVNAPVAVGAHLHKQSEELELDELLARSGQRLTPGLLASLARAGVKSVQVYQRPRIRVLITGDEIVPAEQADRVLHPGEVYDANAPLIRTWLQARGYPEPTMRYVRDDAAVVEAELEAAFEASDLVITNGGSSAGDRDFIPSTAERLGATRVFRTVAQQPGKPLYFARHGDTPLLGLPGNPGAVLIGLVMHAPRVLDRLEGWAVPGPQLYPGRLAQPLKPTPARERLVRARRETTAHGVLLTPLPKQAAHMISNLAEADALVRIPPGDKPLPAGAPLLWTPLYTV